MPAASDANSSVATGRISLVGSLERALPGRDDRDRRQHVQPDEEHAHQQRADHELRQRDRRQRHDRDGVVGRAPGVDGRDSAQAQRQRDHEQGGDHRQDQRVLDRIRDQRPHRRVLLALGEADRGVAQVTVHEPAQPVGVLGRQRLVEVHLLLQPLHGRRRGTAAQHHAGGVAGQDGGADEDQHRRHQQRHRRAQQATAHEGENRRNLAVGRSRFRNSRHRVATRTARRS